MFSIFSTGFTMHGDPDYVDANGNAGSSPGTCPRGFLWGTDQNNLTNEIIDTTSSNNNSDPATFMGGTMAYSYALGGLNASTAYYYRAFISTGSDICDGGSNPGTRIYGDIRALTTAAPQLAFTAFDTYIGTSSPETLGDTVTEQSGQNRIFFKITASQDLAGMKIPVVSLNIIAPSAGAGDIGDFSISNSMLINGSTINDLAPIEFGGGGGASNNEAITMLQLIADNKTEGNETYRLTISPNYVDAAGNVQGQHGLNTSIDFIINDTSIYQPTDIGYGLTPYNLLGSPVVTTTNGVTVSKYTFDNTNGTYGPNHIIFLNTYDDLDPIIHTSDTTTQNTVYWSNDPNGATNDHSSINGSGNSAIVSNTTVDTNQTTGTGTGFVNNNASVVFDDGAASSGMPELNEGLISG